jgi:hypothetical protein
MTNIWLLQAVIRIFKCPKKRDYLEKTQVLPELGSERVDWE